MVGFTAECRSASSGIRNKSYTTSFNFENGYYYPKEHDFRGFGHVKTFGPYEGDGKQLIKESWFHQANGAALKVPTGYLKGKPYRTITYDSADRYYSEVETSYDSLGTPDYYFNPPKQVDTYTCDGSKSHLTCKARTDNRHTKVIYGYDSFGNIQNEYVHGDVDNPENPSLNRTTIRNYTSNTDQWIVGLPINETVYAGIGTAEGSKISHTDYYYDGVSDCSVASTNQNPIKGNLTRIVRWNNSEPNADQENLMAYDGYGNLKCSRDPNGYVTTTTYDSSNTFPIRATNQLGHEVVTSYYGVDGVLA